MDFIIGMTMAIEVKASIRAHAKDLKGLRAFDDEGRFEKRLLVCRKEQDRTTEDGIRILLWRRFPQELCQSS